MPFFSTRGESVVTASQAILRGIAPDGGLYVPAMFHNVRPERLTSLTEMNYEQRAVAVLKRFLEDFSVKEIEDDEEAMQKYNRYMYELEMKADYEVSGETVHGIEHYLPKDVYQQEIHHKEVAKHIMSKKLNLA